MSDEKVLSGPLPRRLIFAGAALAMVLIFLVWAQQMTLTAAAVVAVVAGLGAWAVLRRHRQRLIGISRKIAEMGRTNKQPIPIDGGDPVSALDTAVDRLTQDFAAARTEFENELATSQYMIDQLPDPILLISRQAMIRQSNVSARRWLGDAIDGRALALALRHPVVLDAVDRTLDSESSAEEVDFQEQAPVKRVMRARILRLNNPDTDRDATVAAMMVVQDLTPLYKAEAMRGEFVANASHELRTPLATLTGFIETLRGPARDDAAARDRFLTIMADEALRMGRLIDDLLSLSRIEQDEHLQPEETVDLAAVLRRVIDLLQLRAAEREIELALELEKMDPVVGDKDQLTEVFQNLIDNALKYSPDGGRVRILGRQEGPVAVVSVIDYGPGIPEEAIPRLTERFYRVDKVRSRKLGGTGLGLAIVKHIVNRHRGKLAIESEVGEGSRFTVYLPAESRAVDR